MKIEVNINSTFMVCFLATTGMAFFFRHQLIELLAANFYAAVTLGFVAGVWIGKTKLNGKIFLPWAGAIFCSAGLAYLFLCNEFLANWKKADDCWTDSSVLSTIVVTPMYKMAFYFNPKNEGLFDFNLDMGMQYMQCIVASAASAMAALYAMIGVASFKARKSR